MTYNFQLIEAEAEIEKLKAEVERLRARVEAVLKLHKESDSTFAGKPWCSMCKDAQNNHVDWPCATVRALEGEMIDAARKRLAVLADSFPSSELAADIHSLLAEVERLRAALQGIIANGHEQVENRAGDLYCVEVCAACAADAALHARPGDDVVRA